MAFSDLVRTAQNSQLIIHYNHYGTHLAAGVMISIH